MTNTLKQQISIDFTDAYKNKDNVIKSALSFLKAKIIEAEKNNKNIELNDSEALKVILSSIKQRKDSISQFKTANRLDLVEKEQLELNVLNKYLPQQLSVIELKEKAIETINTITLDPNNKNKNVGIIMGQLNKAYSGQFNMDDLKTLLNELL